MTSTRHERGLFNIDKKIYELKDKLFKLKKQQLELEDSILALEEERMFSSRPSVYVELVLGQH